MAEMKLRDCNIISNEAVSATYDSAPRPMSAISLIVSKAQRDYEIVLFEDEVRSFLKAMES